MEITKKVFKDTATYDEIEKSAISIRDGVLNYLGGELGIEPYDKVFRVYRSPATIANTAMVMSGIPIVDEHVTLDNPIASGNCFVKNASMIDLLDEETGTKLAVKNILVLDEQTAEKLKTKRQLSLGYFADLKPSEEFDFEQTNIVPHHLAIVESGRCGAMCSFLDKLPKQESAMPQVKLCDENGNVNIEDVVGIVMALPDIIKTLPLDKVQEIMPYLMQIAEYSKPSAAVENISEGEVVAVEKTDEAMTPAEEKKEEEKKPEFADKAFEDSVAIKAKEFADAAILEYSNVVDKARDFLDSAYIFAGKSASQIMVDCLATECTTKFEDKDISIAFKLLKKSADYKTFGDNKTEHFLDAIANKELS